MSEAAVRNDDTAAITTVPPNNYFGGLRGNGSRFELWSIRYPNVVSNRISDTRPPGTFSNTPIIYNGKLDFQNTNPKETFCYDCSPNLINEEITLYIDNNFNNETGVKDGINVAVSFILYDVEEVEIGLDNAPDVNFKSNFTLRNNFLI